MSVQEQNQSNDYIERRSVYDQCVVMFVVSHDYGGLGVGKDGGGG